MLYSEVQDAELITRYASGDERAFEVLMLRHGDPLFAAIVSKVKDRDVADDIFQEVWIKFIHSVKSGDYAESGKFAAWIHRVARNATMDFFRKQQRSPVSNSEHMDLASDGIADEALNAEERAVAMQWMHDAHEAVQTASGRPKDRARAAAAVRLEFQRNRRRDGGRNQYRPRSHALRRSQLAANAARRNTKLTGQALGS
jgi:RNA polymerase sigma factor (sigma-70 family)